MKKLLLLSFLLVVSCGLGQEKKAVDLPPDGAIQVDYEELMRAKDFEGIVIVDVRTRDEYMAGHIEGSILIPYDQIEYRLSELKDYKQIILYCGTNRRSTIAYNYLKNHFDYIYIL